MANAAAKKNAAKAAQVHQSYTLISVVVHCVFVLVQVLSWRVPSLGLGCTFLGFASVCHLCTAYIHSSISSGYGYEYPQDLLFLTWAVELGILYSSYAALLYLVVPLYGAGLLLQYCRNQSPAPSAATEEIMSDAELRRIEKREAKKQRKRDRMMR